ncbi:hypothetical protein [Pseudomonas putida]|uniref:Transposase IS4 family protein n=1 Tax=Pseudomonas putida TaxID=303 RepID=A0A1L7NF09_PSEPU|nr:hypothetical protein [Pseudomonas putida]BAW24045.1 Transposase IS4 family protein [Pseudomonas putida]
MSQMSFSHFEYAAKRKQTRRERFLWATHHFGIRAHIGADAESGLVQYVHGTAHKNNSALKLG